MRGEADMANERRTKRAYEFSREDLKNFVFENSLDFELNSVSETKRFGGVFRWRISDREWPNG